MAEELRDHYSERIYTCWNKDEECTWGELPAHRKDVYREWVDEVIMAPIKKYCILAKATQDPDKAEEIDEYLFKAFDGERVLINSEYKFRISMAERIALRDKILALFDEEAIRKDEREKVLKLYDDMMEQMAFSDLHIVIDKFRQALKEK